MSLNRGSEAEKDAEAMVDKFQNVDARDVTALTRRILWKMDTRILPVLALLFLCSFLDRTNVGNAKIIGLEEDIGISNLQYNQGLAVFYATYIASELPSNLVLKKLTPKIWLPLLTVVWGIITMCLGFVRNFGSFFAVRALLGIAEGGLLPGIVLYLSGLYTRQEMALRIGIFYTAASLSGAFGGLLARGLSAIAPRGGLEGWRWIFIIEGLITIVAGVIAYLLLPTNIVEASFLTDEEKTFAADRLQGRFRSGSGSPDRFDPSLERGERFKWSEVYRGIFNLQVWFTATAYFGILAGLYSFGLFLPTIINDLKITSDPNQSQLWSVIPYAVATPVTVFIAFLSDRMKLRGVMMLFTLPIAIVGYAVIANVTSPHVRFGMTCIMAIGMYSSVPCVLVWNSNNSAGHYKRATTSALQLAIANCGGFVATFAYPNTDAPLYHRGHTIILGLLVYSWFAILANVLWCMKINRDKASGKYDKFIGNGDDRDPAFKMIL
ncbi:major facilitator superfamily domain-containing protein [Podospora aff. communis PSN243]|uniref:Major facilitator superfamily domain-containing protein n=1 Tax=Podospora aff. communis PSN243 TaxID=3040156 RepID=A0AAV9GWA4_9PEZI|nr:major facilitator superfamily domain-containing protein [Podospora aff. communis PSN243]